MSCLKNLSLCLMSGHYFVNPINVKYFCLFDIIIIISSYKAKITAIISDFNNIILMSENIREGKDYLRSRCYRRTFYYLKIRSR